MNNLHENNVSNIYHFAYTGEMLCFIEPIKALLIVKAFKGYKILKRAAL
jgi:hypothetical protein